MYLAVEHSDAQLELELRKADVVCVVYAVDDEDTLDVGSGSVTGCRLWWLSNLRRHTELHYVG